MKHYIKTSQLILIQFKFVAVICNILFLMSVKDSECQNNENICSKYPSNVIVANPNDCFSFFACQHGHAMKIICPNNSMFNPKLGNCDSTYLGCMVEEKNAMPIIDTDEYELLSEDTSYESTSTNTISDNGTTTDNGTATDVTNEQFTSTSPNVSTTTSISSSSTTDAEPNPMMTTDDPNNCLSCTTPIPPYNFIPQCPPNDTEIPTFLPSNSFCDSYFLCYHGRPFEMFCSIGYYWNQELNECILERDSNCIDSTMQVPACPSKGQHFFPHSDRCSYFYYCENGIRSIQQCSAFKQWDIIEQTCKIDINARCIKTIPRSQREKYYFV